MDGWFDGWMDAFNLRVLRYQRENTNSSGRQKSSPLIRSGAINIDSAELALKVVTIRWVGVWREVGWSGWKRMGSGIKGRPVQPRDFDRRLRQNSPEIRRRNESRQGLPGGQAGLH